MQTWSAALAEASDAEALFVAGLFLAGAAASRLSPDGRASQGRATRFFFVVFLALLPAAAVLRLQGAGSYAAVRALVLLLGAETAVMSAFDVLAGLLKRLRIAVPRIVQDVGVAAAAALAALAVASRVGVNLSGLIATSAVLTAVIGFSLQDTLGNVMGGLFLQVDNSVEVGDWIKLGELTGKVAEIRWRYTAVETSSGDTAVIPNSILMKNQVLILGRRAGAPRRQRRTVQFNVDFRRAPSQVIDAVSSALVDRRIANVAENPPPSVILSELGDSYARYTVRYWLTDLSADQATDSVIRSYVYFALKRAGIALAVPASAQFVLQQTEEQRAQQLRGEIDSRRDAISRVDFLRGLTEEDRDQLADCLHPAPFAAGEVITRQGAEAHWLYLVTQGSVSIRLASAGLEKEIARLGPGEFFGEMSLLTGKPRSTTVVALTEVRSFRLGKDAFESILARRPELADGLADVLTRRRSELVSAREGLDGEAAAKRLAADRRDLVAGIRRFFNLPLDGDAR